MRSEQVATAGPEEVRGPRARSASRHESSSTVVRSRSSLADTEAQLPSHFRRRSEPLPGTYNREGVLARLPSSSGEQDARVQQDFGSRGAAVGDLTPVDEALRVREAALEKAQNEREPAWMRRGARAAGETRSLTAADEAVIRDLQKLERNLMGREMEQARVGGGVTGRGRHVVETGPDGERYVTDGDTTPSIVRGGSPEQELARARAVRRAALAPASPSAKDLSVANEAARLERAAEKELEDRAPSLGAAEAAEEAEGSDARANLDSLMQAAASRREELRAAEDRDAMKRAEARESLKVATIDDPTIPNIEVVALQRQVAVDAYVTQL